MRRYSVPAAIVLALSLLLVPADAVFAVSGPNLIKNGSFEAPTVTAASHVKKYTVLGSNIKHCSSAAIGCWLLTAGEVDLTRTPAFAPKSGFQSLELYTGSMQGEIGQSMPTVTPGVKYQLTFYLSSDPTANDNLGVTVFLYNVDGHGDTIPGGVQQSFTYFDPSHTASNMKFRKQKMTYTSLSSEMRIAIQANGFLGDPTVGPVVDSVRLNVA